VSLDYSVDAYPRNNTLNVVTLSGHIRGLAQNCGSLKSVCVHRRGDHESES